MLFRRFCLKNEPINWEGFSQTKRKLGTQRPFQWKGKAKKMQGMVVHISFIQRSFRSKASPCFELRRCVAELPRVCLWSSQGPRSDLRKGNCTSGCAAYTAEMLDAFLFWQLGLKAQLHGNFLFWWVPVFWHCQLTHFFKSIANDFRGLPKRITGSLRTLRVQPPWPCQYHRGTYEPSWFASCAGFWTRVAWNRVLGNHGSPIDFAPWEPRNIETSLIS